MVIIVVAQNMDFFPDHIERLKSLGDVTFYNDLSKTPEEWLKRCKGADIICTGKLGLKEKVYELENVFISLPFVGVGWLEKEKLKKRNITVSSSPGCNKSAVAEWIVCMMLNLLMEFPKYIRATDLAKGVLPQSTKGLKDKKVCILGKGNIGTRVGEMCKAFNADICYFIRGDDLCKTVKDADIVVDCLGYNPTTHNLLNNKFFSAMKKGSYFITVTGPQICDVDAMIDAINKGILIGAAHDSGGIQVGDVYDPFYRKLLKHPKILVTPHISYNTDVRDRFAMT